MSARRPISRLVTARGWHMVPGERAALEGILALLEPSLAIEVGTHKGASLERIAFHSRWVHAFDLERDPELTSERFPNVTFHIGDSHDLLPRLLEQLAEDGENVDFAFVDGDHSVPGVRRDVEDLLGSASVRDTTIVLHDTLNERVRAGLEQVDYASLGKVRYVDLDFVQGRVLREGPYGERLWWGLGLIVTGAELGAEAWPPSYGAPDVYEAFSSSLLAVGHAGERFGQRQLLELEEEVTEQRNIVRLMEDSWSWRLTRPLRAAKARLRPLIR